MKPRARDAFRALGALLCFYLIVAVVAQALAFILPSPWGNSVAGVIAPIAVQLVIGALLANLLWAARRWRAWRDMGWPGLTPGLRAFGVGLGLGLVMAAVALALELSVGRGRIGLTGEPFSAYAKVAVLLLPALAVAALSEELLFRGFPLSRLSDALGPAGASLLLALGFAGLHAVNPGVTLLGLVNVALASLALSAVYFKFGGLPAAWGMHFAWNAGLGVGVDAPVSGIAFRLPGIDYSADGASWVTGGLFGPEGGAIGTAVMGAVVVWLGGGLLGLTPVPSPLRSAQGGALPDGGTAPPTKRVGEE